MENRHTLWIHFEETFKRAHTGSKDVVVSFKALSVIFKVLFHVSTWQALMSGGAKTSLGLGFSSTTRSSHSGLPA